MKTTLISFLIVCISISFSINIHAKNDKKLKRYYISEKNFKRYYKLFDEKYPCFFKVYIYSYSLKDVITAEEKSKASDILDILSSRPVNTENYDILNMIGITIKMQEYNIKTKNRKDAIKAIIDEGGFSGTLTALNFGNKFFPESELNSTNKDVIRLKLATLDMFLQNYPDAEASESILKKLKENETNKDVLSKVDQLLELE